MGELAKLHDDALEHEYSILGYTEQISDLRVKMYEEKDKEQLAYIIPALNSLIDEAEKYKEWIKEKVAEMNESKA